LHLDPEYVKKTIFGRNIAHGLLTLGVALREWYSLEVTRESVVAFVGINNLFFRAPVFPRDSVTLKSEVTAVRPSKSHSDLGLVTFKDLMLNQKGESVLEFERTLMLMKGKTAEH
jgi:acyl dehydratase